MTTGGGGARAVKVSDHVCDWGENADKKSYGRITRERLTAFRLTETDSFTLDQRPLVRFNYRLFEVTSWKNLKYMSTTATLPVLASGARIFCK